MKKEFSSYIFGFLDKEGIPYDYCFLDDFDDNATWEEIQSKFSLSNSKYLLIWRKDRQKFATSEANGIIIYVKNNSHKFNKKNITNSKKESPEFSSMFIPTRDCVIIAYDKLVLPQGNINWKNFVDLVSFKIDDLMSS